MDDDGTGENKSMSMKQLDILSHLFRLLREVDKDGIMPIQTAHCLLIVARNPGKSQQFIQQELGLSQSSTSRAVQALSKWSRLGKPGYDLVEQVEDPMDTRKKIVFLTPKGKALIGRALGLLEGHFDGRIIEFNSPTAKGHLKGIYEGVKG